MSGEKLVLRDAEERAFWRMAHMAHAACWAGGVEGVYGTCEDVADAAVRAYRERCGTPEPVADDAHLARCWRDLVDKLPNEAFAEMDLDEHSVDAIVRNFKRLLAARSAPATDGPWAVWMPKEGCWWSGGDEEDNNSPGLYYTVRAYCTEEEAGAENHKDWIVAPFPRTPEEFRNGPKSGGGA